MSKYTCLVVFSCCLVLCVGHKAVCGPNEELQCIQSCPPQVTCANRHIATSCLYTGDSCEHTCVCKGDLIRNDAGECIPVSQCENCVLANEFFECGSACDNECATLGTQNRTHCPIKNIVCNRKCYCEDGYARDEDGYCIPVEECPKYNINDVDSSMSRDKNLKEETRLRRHSQIHLKC